MDERFVPLWAYLNEKDLASFSVVGFKEFLKKNAHPFCFNISEFNDLELFSLLFLDVEMLIENIVIDPTFSKKDQLFEGFMTVFDYFSPYKDLFLRLEKDIFKHPCFLKIFLQKTDRIIAMIEKKYTIESIELEITNIPYFKNFLNTQQIMLPSIFNTLVLKGIIFSLFSYWIHDQSDDIEATAVKINTVLEKVKIRSLP
ncbi:MAG: hypothetical protein HEEMFOPI_01058 [Holosporales bacterium]